MKRKPTIASVARDMMSIYEEILGERDFGMAKQLANTTGRRLRFLDMLARGETSARSLAGEQVIELLEAALDCKGLQCATGSQKGVFDPLKVDDVKVLGRRNRLRGDLLADDDQANDWYFALLVRAWTTSKTSVPLRDLCEDSRFESVDVCDFLVEGPDRRVELLECKRVHPGKKQSENVLQDVVAKVWDRLQDAGRQLRETTYALQDPHSCRHALIDISAYDKRTQEECDQVEVTGFEDSAIEEIRTAALTDRPRGVDRLTICWRNVVSMEARPVAITQRAITTDIGEARSGFVDYDGWTVEGYPTHWSSYELRVSTTARSLAWIKHSYLSCAKADFLTYGEVETRPEGPQ